MSLSPLSHLMDLQARCPGAYRLAKVAALATRIEPALLRSLRLTLLPGVATVAEAELFHSTIVLAKNRAGIVLYPDVAATLRDELRKDADLLDKSWAVIIRHHDERFPVLLRMQEEITYLALRQAPTEELERQFNKIVATMRTQERGQSLAAWAVRALPTLPEVARKLDAALRLAVGANARLGGEYIQAPLGSVLPPDLHWALPQHLGTHAIAIIREDKDVLLDASNPLPSERTATLMVPKTYPLLIEVYAESECVALVKLKPGGQTRLHVGYRMLSFRVPGHRYEEVPSRRQLRAIMHSVLLRDSDFDAFVLDYFDNVYKNYSKGMIKDSKINSLFEAELDSAIWRALRTGFPTETLKSYFSRLSPTNESIGEDFHKRIPERWELDRFLEALPLTYQQNHFDLVDKLIMEQLPRVSKYTSVSRDYVRPNTIDDLVADLFRYALSTDEIWRALQLEYPEHCSRLWQADAGVPRISAFVNATPASWKLRRLLYSLPFPKFWRTIWVHFPKTGRQLTGSMDKVRCTNILFEHNQVEDIFSAIQLSLPEWAVKMEHFLELNPHAVDGLPPLSEEQLYQFVERALPVHDDFDAILIDFFPKLYGNLNSSNPLNVKLTFIWNEGIAHELILRIVQTLNNADEIYRDIISSEQRGLTLPIVDMNSINMESTPSGASVRRLLSEVFKTSSDFDAFVLNFYPSLYRQFSAEMDRRQQTNFLIEHIIEANIVQSVHQADPKRFARYQHLLEYN